MNILTAIIFGLYESVWRRTHGGGPISNWFNKYISPWLFGLTARVFFTTLNLIAFTCLGFFFMNLVWWKVLILVGSIWIFWDSSFGMYMDMGRNYPATYEDVKNYRKTPFNWVLHWMFPDSMQFGKTYDFIQMWFRYTWPVLLLPIFKINSWWFLLIGLSIACFYSLGWKLYERGRIKIGPTELAEYLSGFALGFLICLI